MAVHRVELVRRMIGLPLACFIGSVAALPDVVSGPAKDFYDYRLMPGDTLIGVTQRLLRPGTNWRALRAHNRISQPRRLRSGQWLHIPLSLLREQAVVAEVVYAHGEVSIERGGATAAALRSGETLSAGDLVRTGPQSSTALRFADGSRLMLRPGSALRVERMVRVGPDVQVDTRVQLDQGGAETRVPAGQVGKGASRLEIRTPVANLGVRGTDFRAAVDGPRASVEVLEGTVGVSTTRVPEGFGVVASPAGVSTPRELLAAPQLAGITLVERLPIDMTWPALPGAASYRVQLRSALEPERPLLEGRFATPRARWQDDLPDGRYLLSVRAADSDGIEGRDASVAVTLKARPEPPFLNEPRAGERVAQPQVTFSWSRVALASRYRLQLSDSADFARPYVDRQDLVTNRVELEVEMGLTHWRLASIRGEADVGPWSDAQTLTRIAPPPAPQQQAPQAGADGVLLRWSDSPGARWQLQLARDAGFTQVLVDQTVDQPSWTVRGVDAGTYFLRVRTTSADGFTGPFGGTQIVEVPSSPWWWLLLPALLLLTL